MRRRSAGPSSCCGCVRFFKLGRATRPGMRSLVRGACYERAPRARCLRSSSCWASCIAVGVADASGRAQRAARTSSAPSRTPCGGRSITLTTVGYGDVVPITPLGKIVASLTAVHGLVMLALPVGIVATALRRGHPPPRFRRHLGHDRARVPLFADLDGRRRSPQIMQLLRSHAAEPGEIDRAAGRDGRTACISSLPARWRSSCRTATASSPRRWGSSSARWRCSRTRGATPPCAPQRGRSFWCSTPATCVL